VAAGAGRPWQNARVDSLAITVVGPDRPGIISAVAGVLSSYRMNLEDSSMTLLRGHFAMTLVCAGDAPPAEVERALVAAVDPSLAVTVRPVPEEDEPAPVGSTQLVTVHGADRLGLVAQLAGTIAAAGGNITDLTTRLTGALYVLVAEVDLPPGADVDALAAALTGAAAELGVDVTMHPVENDDL
jgi:glycine cleavage system transcriptional repressor